MSKLTDFISLIDEEVDTSVNVCVPSNLKDYSFEQITVTQQKRLIKGTLSGVKGNIMLLKTFNDIIMANCETDVDFLITDRNAILVQLRIASLGTRVTDDNGNTTSLNEDMIGAYLKEPPITDGRVTYKGIEVQLKTPTLKTDQKFFNLFEDKEYDNAGDVVNDLYAAEAAKFIKSVTIGDTSLASIPPKEAVKLIDNLPLALNVKIVDFVKQAKEYDAMFLKATNKSDIVLSAKLFNAPD